MNRRSLQVLVPLILLTGIFLWNFFFRTETLPGSCPAPVLAAWEREVRFEPVIRDAVMEGWVIRSLEPESQWAKAGFALGDSIHTFNGRAPLSRAAFLQELGDLCRPGITIVFYRRNRAEMIRSELFLD